MNYPRGTPSSPVNQWRPMHHVVHFWDDGGLWIQVNKGGMVLLSLELWWYSMLHCGEEYHAIVSVSLDAVHSWS